jgi:dihydroorotate dehydrogenase electron transfer subunit
VTIRSRCEVLSSRAAGAFQSVTLVAPEIAERARPGQFVEVAMPEGRATVLRRPLYIHQASRRGGWAGTVELIVDRQGPGTSWVAGTSAHEFVDLIGPLGNGFGIPRPTNCLLVGVGYAAAPLYFLAEELRSRGKRVDMLVGAPSQDRLLKPIEGKRLAHSITIVTEDGSVGERADPLDVLPECMQRSRTQVVYAAGPHELIRQVAEHCRAQKIPAQIAVEELMACGLGLCLSCTVPVSGPHGKGPANARACVEGPVFSAGRILWDRWLGTAAGAEPSPEDEAGSVEPGAPVGSGR